MLPQAKSILCKNFRLENEKKIEMFPHQRIEPNKSDGDTLNCYPIKDKKSLIEKQQLRFLIKK